MNWFESLPAAEAAVPCGTGTHMVRWEAGRLTLPAHPDLEAELVLAALGAGKPRCVTLSETWASHAADLTVLTAGPRSGADKVSVDWAEIAELRDQLSAGWPRVGSAPRLPATPGPGAPPGRRPRTLGYPMAGPGAAEAMHRRQQHVELLELLALGPRFQFRLAGTVTAAWSGSERADERAGRRPELSGVLTGRFAPAAQEWLGIAPDAVTVMPYEGTGWGTLEVTGTGAGRRLRAALPVGWLASVWACGLAVASGHLVVAVEEPGYPVARVRALPAPGAEPVVLTVRAAGDGEAGLLWWTAAG